MTMPYIGSKLKMIQKSSAPHPASVLRLAITRRMTAIVANRASTPITYNNDSADILSLVTAETNEANKAMLDLKIKKFLP